MSLIDACSGLKAGVQVLACISEQASYIPAYMILILFFAILFWKIGLEPARDRFAATLLVTAVIAMLMSVMELLPPQGFVIPAVLAVGAIAMLIIRKD